MLIKGVRQVIFYLCRYVTAPDKRHLRSAEAGKRGLCVHQIESTCRIVFLRQEITEISDVFDKFFYCCPEVTVSDSSPWHIPLLSCRTVCSCGPEAPGLTSRSIFRTLLCRCRGYALRESLLPDLQPAFLPFARRVPHRGKIQSSTGQPRLRPSPCK